MGTRTGFVFSCGTTLIAVKTASFSADTLLLCNGSSVSGYSQPFTVPSAAHLLLRFSYRSQLHGTLCGCACSLTSASSVSLLRE